MKLSHILLLLYTIIWLLLAYDPSYRQDWLLENILVLVALTVIVLTRHHVRFSYISVWMLFIFFTMHAIGAHYTYAQMPWFDPVGELFGFDRNHYDRFVHFLFGFLFFLPLFDFFRSYKIFQSNAFLVSALVLLASSGTYEIIEWIATELTNKDLGIAFLGAQGDVWDAQKDMLFAHLGTLLAMILFYRRARTSKDS